MVLWSCRGMVLPRNIFLDQVEIGGLTPKMNRKTGLISPVFFVILLQIGRFLLAR